MSYYYLQTSNDHLEHHGVLGMRWGIRRYQPYAKGHRGGKEVGEAAKKSRGGSLRERRAKKKMSKQQAEILNRARLSKKAQEDRRKELEEVIKRPTAESVLDFVDVLSTQDLKDLNDRIKEIKNLETTARAEKDRGFNTIDSIMKKVEKVKNWGKTGVETYNTMNDILKILDGTYKKSSSNQQKTKQ